MANPKIHEGISRYSEFLLIILGIITAIGPYTLYHICSGSMAGPCQDTGHAAIILGATIAVVSLASLFIQNRSVRAYIGLAAVILAVLSILFVTVITGTCDSSMMACNRTGKPGIIAVGAITAIVGVIDLILLKYETRVA